MRKWAEQEQLLTLLQGTAEAMGGELKPAALALMASNLEPYPFHPVETALARCRAEVSGRLTLAVIIDRLQGADTRPAPNEAWAMVLKARDENETVVWCQEMEKGWWASVEILRNGDKVGARMAFIEVYNRQVSEARIAGTPAKWTVSPGRDSELRRIAVEKACEQGVLTQVQRLALAPPVAATSGELLIGKGSGTRQVRKLLHKLNVRQRMAAQQARADQVERSTLAQTQRVADAARKAEILQRAQAHPLWAQTPIDPPLTEATT
ncbi:MAG: hypothetical protein WBX11_15640 [Thiobacillaceae bacterium]|jgi:hypothetical protein